MFTSSNIYMSDKTSICSWWILAVIAVLLWYRNYKYDRALSVFIFTLGLIQLINYGIYNGANVNQSGKTLFLLFWLQCLILAVSVFLFINSKNNDNKILNTITTWNLFIFALIFAIALIIFFTNGDYFIAKTNNNGNIELSMSNGKQILGNFTWLYLLGIIVPLILLFYYYGWKDWGLALLIIYLILSIAYVACNYPSNQFFAIWNYSMIGFAFLAWFVGIFKN